VLCEYQTISKKNIPTLDRSKDENKYMKERNGNNRKSNFRTSRRSCSALKLGSSFTCSFLISFSLSNEDESIRIDKEEIGKGEATDTWEIIFQLF
jgi:hypothetical protein